LPSKQPLAATCGHLPQRPLAATCGHLSGSNLRPLAATCPSSHLLAASSCKWLQVAANDASGAALEISNPTCGHVRPLAATCGHLP
jgi:hypothetical protein